MKQGFQQLTNGIATGANNFRDGGPHSPNPIQINSFVVLFFKKGRLPSYFNQPPNCATVMPRSSAAV
jgi:hypothetical protein